MIIGFRPKFLFVHIPKCAGESLSALLLSAANGGGQFLRKHSRWVEASRVIREEMADFTSFAVVRNPFAQAYSFYEHLRKPLRMTVAEIETQYPGSRGRILPHWASLIAMRTPFPEYVQQVYANPAGPDFWFQDLMAWITDAEGAVSVPHLLRHENLRHEFPRLAHALGLVGDLPWLNAADSGGKVRDYRALYDADSRALIETRFASTLNHFGYAF
jgi:hypothetical protein